MTLPFLLLSLLIIVSAIAAMSLRNLVHCALCLTVTFAGLAGLFVLLGAEFVGLVQLLVYVGAVAILIVFAILLTRSGDAANEPVHSSSCAMGIGIAVLAFGSVAFSILSSVAANRPPTSKRSPTVSQIGDQLMTSYVLPLEVIALLLTAALIGAVIIAMREAGKSK